MTTLAHTVRGEGPRPVLLLHGFLGSGRNLATVARRWAERDPSRRFVLPDLTGHGASPPLPPDAGSEALAEDVLALARGLALSEPLEIVGHSLGGRVALRAALLAPEAVGAVTLLDIGPGPMPAEGDRVLEAFRAAPEPVEDRDEARAFLLDRGLPRPIAEWLLMNLVPAGGGSYRWRVDREALAAFHRRFVAEDLWPAVEQGAAKVTAILGGRSGYVSEPEQRRLREAGVPVHVIRGAGHFVHVDAPDVLLDLLGVGPSP